MSKPKKAGSARSHKQRTYSSYVEWEKIHLPDVRHSTDRKKTLSDPAVVTDNLLRNSLDSLRRAMKRPSLR